MAAKKKSRIGIPVKKVEEQVIPSKALTKLEKMARRESKMATRVAMTTSAGGYGGGGAGNNGNIANADSQFFSPQISNDFLELPQSEREKRELFRFWYSCNPIVGAAIDFHTDIPMSKIRLSTPKGKDHTRNKEILAFYQKMCDRVNLFQTLYDATHEYWLQGGVFIFAEDHDMESEIPEDLIFKITEEKVGEIDWRGDAIERVVERKEAIPDDERNIKIRKYVQENYEGWQRLQILPPEQIRLEVFQYTNEMNMSLIPSEKDRNLVQKAQDGADVEAMRIAGTIPKDIRDNLLDGSPIPLNTSPYTEFLCSSFCQYIAHKKSAYEDRGKSILERCHLPGTEVTAKRNGNILQIPIERLDPTTDEVLGGSGQWRKFETGSRPYNGEAIGFDLNKICGQTTWSTYDHKMQVLRGDSLVDITANDLDEDDYVQVASTGESDRVNEFDLHEFFNNEKWDFHCRRTDVSIPVTITPERIGNGCLELKHSFVDKNPQRTSRRATLDKVCDWIRNLDSTIEISSEAFHKKFSLSGNTVYRNIIKDLEEIGYIMPIKQSETLKYKSKVRVFKQSDLDPSPLYSINRTVICPEKLELSGDLGYVVGYYLGDGWTESSRPSATKYGPSGICWQKDSENSSNSIKQINTILTNLNLDVSSYDYELGWIHIHDDWFSRWIGRNFGHNKIDKHLPLWINDSSEEFKLGILRGLIDSDGWANVSGFSIATTTKPLMDQLFLMSTSVGMFPSFYRKDHKKPVLQQDGSYCNNPKPIYTLSFSTKNDKKKIKESGYFAKSELYDTSAKKESTTSGMVCKEFNGNLYTKVRNTQKKHHDGLVYSLNVHEDHTFYANLSLTRNCLRTLNYIEKLRQAQTSIASRAMTPKRIIWAPNMSEMDVEAVRDQVLRGCQKLQIVR